MTPALIRLLKQTALEFIVDLFTLYQYNLHNIKKFSNSSCLLRGAT